MSDEPRRGGLSQLPNEIVQTYSTFLDEADIARLGSTQRPMYRTIEKLFMNKVTLFLDNTASMRGVQNGRVSLMKVMVDVVQQLVGTWETGVQIQIVFVTPPSATSCLAPFHRKMCTKGEVLGRVCDKLLQAERSGHLECRTALCQGLLGLKTVGPTVIITDGSENVDTLASIGSRRLPIYKARTELTVDQAIDRYNRDVGTKHAITRPSPAFSVLLKLLKVYNPEYFLATVVNAHRSVPADFSTDASGLVFQYRVTPANDLVDLVDAVNRTTIPLESGGPPQISMTRRRLTLERSRRVQGANHRLQELVSYTVAGGDNRHTWTILPSRRFCQLRQHGYNPPVRARVKRLGPDCRNWMQLMSEHRTAFVDEILDTESERRDIAVMLMGHPSVKKHLLQLNHAHIVEKVKAKSKKRKFENNNNSLAVTHDELQLLLDPPSISDPTYDAFLVVRKKFSEQRIEIRSPSDWLTVKMDVNHELFTGLFPGHLKHDTVHDHILRGLPFTTLEKDALMLFLDLPLPVRRRPDVQTCTCVSHLFAVAAALLGDRNYPDLSVVLHNYVQRQAAIEGDPEVVREMRDFLRATGL